MLTINDTAAKTIRRKVGSKIRSGAAVAPAEQRTYERVCAALDYLCYRDQCGVKINGWWDLPIAARLWAADARDRNA